MAEDKYALLRELLKEERGLFGKYYNQIKPSGGFTDYAANLFNEALEIRVCSLMKELLSERDALVKEREENSWHIPSYESIFNKCQFGIYVGTCDYTCGPTTCPKMREDQK